MCGTVYANEGARTMHIRYSHKGYVPAQPDLGKPLKKFRTRQNLGKKILVMERYWKLEERGASGIKTLIAKEVFGAGWETKLYCIGRWVVSCGKFRNNLLTNRDKLRRTVAIRPAQYPTCEDEVYRRLVDRRKRLKYPCNHYWVQVEMRSILDEDEPVGFKAFKCSNGWASLFCTRYRLTTQCVNNIKAQDASERMFKIQKFHTYVQALQDSLPQKCMKYGRFPPRNMFHVDQVPLPFSSPQNRTLHMKGSKTCPMAGPNTAGLEKRQATLQLWICADPDQQCIRPALIFRGKRDGPLPWPQEQAHYDEHPNIRVHFQKNAWADSDFVRQDLAEVAQEMFNGGVVGEALVGMDNYSAQKTPTIMSRYNDFGMIPLFTPAGCTDCVSPVDHHVGVHIQRHMAAAYRKEVLNNPENWIQMDTDEEVENPESGSAMARRMLMVTWLDAAWTDLIQNHKHLLSEAFVQTGFLLAKDGSEDDLIKLQGWSLDSLQYWFRRHQFNAASALAPAPLAPAPAPE